MRRPSLFRHRSALGAGLVAILVACHAGAALAARTLPMGDCLPVCNVSCVKPLSIPDRWDDVTPITGHDAWRGNGILDSEPFVDGNGNLLYDPGEAFTDENANGTYDTELYHPLLTGYIPDPYPGNVLSPLGDSGLELTLKCSSAERVQGSHYFAVAFPALNRGTPDRGAATYRRNLTECAFFTMFPGDRLELETGNMAGPTVAAVNAILAQDAAAYYDPATQRVLGSIHPEGASPRLIYVSLYDPRTAPKSGRGEVQVSKIAAFFLSAVNDAGDVRGVFLKVRIPQEPCTCCGDLAVNWLRTCP